MPSLVAASIEYALLSLSISRMSPRLHLTSMSEVRPTTNTEPVARWIVNFESRGT
jgi:hypothetical protein